MHVCLQSTLWHQDQSADISKTALYKQAQEVTGRKVFTSNKRDVKAERLFCGLFRISNARAASTSLFFVKIQLGFEMETLKPLLNLTYESLPWVSSCLPKLSPQLVQRSVHLYWKPGYNNQKVPVTAPRQSFFHPRALETPADQALCTYHSAVFPRLFLQEPTPIPQTQHAHFQLSYNKAQNEPLDQRD